jgi:hypothetical protein
MSGESHLSDTYEESSCALVQVKYFTDTNSTTTATSSASSLNATLSSEGEAICGPFAWADVGIMGGLWLILLLVQGYFLMYVSIFLTFCPFALVSYFYPLRPPSTYSQLYSHLPASTAYCTTLVADLHTQNNQNVLHLPS